MRLPIQTLWVGAALTLASTGAWSQNSPAGLPKGTIKLVVPFAPGGGVDTAARLLAKQLQVGKGLTVIIENRAGGSGTVGGTHVRNAAPDGQTLLFSASTHVLAKEVLTQPPYDPVKDFTPVSRVAEAPLLMVIAPQLPQRKVQEVAEAVRQHPERWTAAVPAFGSASHIGTLLFAKQANVKLTTVAYRGTGPALADVAGGHTQILIDSIVSLLPMAKDGKVRPIATTSAKRTTIAPDIPTAAESGVRDLVYATWYGVWAPPHTPPALVTAWNQAINAAMMDLEKSGALAPIGLDPIAETPEQFKRFIDADVQRSAELLKASGYKPE